MYAQPASKNPKSVRFAFNPTYSIPIPMDLTPGFGRLREDLLFSHFDIRRRLWEYLVIFVAILAPLEISFVFFVTPDVHIGVFCLTFLTDIFFAVDNFVIRRTIFLSTSEIVRDIDEITRAYGRKSMWVHILSIIPLSWIGIVVHNRWVYLGLSFTRLLRLFRAYRATRAVSDLLPYANCELAILPLFFAFVVVVHVFGLILLAVAYSEDINSSFLQKFAIRGFDTLRLYFCSVYFVMTTIFTIGFGDLSPTTRTETIIVLVLEVIGISLTSLVTSYLVSILIDPEETDYIYHYKVMQNYMRLWKLPAEEHSALREFCQYQWETTRGTGNIKRILESLPSTIRNTVKLEMVHAFFEGCLTFQRLPQSILVYVADGLVLKTFSPGDLISKQGDVADRIYFFQSGLLSVIMDGRRVATQPCGDGLIMCEYEMLLGEVKASSLKANTYMEAWYYTLSELIDLIGRKAEIRLMVLESLEAVLGDRFPTVLKRVVPNDALRQAVIDFNAERAARKAATDGGAK
jgi:hypothetical protein